MISDLLDLLVQAWGEVEVEEGIGEVAPAWRLLLEGEGRVAEEATLGGERTMKGIGVFLPLEESGIGILHRRLVVEAEGTDVVGEVEGRGRGHAALRGGGEFASYYPKVLHGAVRALYL